MDGWVGGRDYYVEREQNFLSNIQGNSLVECS